jgi:hypothetical protein
MILKKKLNCEKISNDIGPWMLKFEMWKGVKVWDVKEKIKKGLIKWPMGDSTCISPQDE